MATIRLPEDIHERAGAHLFSDAGEHFAFFLAHWTSSNGNPVFLVHDVILISDADLTYERDGIQIDSSVVIEIVNSAIRSGSCLIELHNHGGSIPRFSRTDLRGFQEFVPYVLQSLPGRPYASTVWGDTMVYGEYFLQDGEQGKVDSITVVGKTLSQIVSSDDTQSPPRAFDRQIPWFSNEGQRQLGRLRVGIVGCGGTGSQTIQNLTYLGVRDFVLVDHDGVDETNFNRLVTANRADLDTPKALLGRRLIRSLAPDAKVTIVEAPLQTRRALDLLKGVDILFGCLDNDGGRLILNELALAYRIPYFDLAVGIEAENSRVSLVGGRLAVVLPNGPCLNCMREIDPQEASYFLMNEDDRHSNVERGYVKGMDIPAPAVVSLNAAISAAAINEFCIFVSGARSVNAFSELDLLGIDRQVSSQWLTPRQIQRDPSCVQCAVAGHGDYSDIARYAVISV